MNQQLRAVLLKGGERARLVLDRLAAEEERVHRLEEEREERQRRLRERAHEYRDGWLLRGIWYGRASGW